LTLACSLTLASNQPARSDGTVSRNSSTPMGDGHPAADHDGAKDGSHSNATPAPHLDGRGAVAKLKSDPVADKKWEELETKAEETFVKGDLPEAAKLWQKAVDFASSDPSQELNLATSLNQLNHLYTRTGEYELSHTNLHKALEIRQRYLDPNDHLIAETMGNLAVICDALHKPKESEEWYQKSLVIKRKILKPDAPELAVTMHNLARLYASEKRFKDSIDLLSKALEIDKKHYGEKHLEVVRDLTTLGISCYECREYQQSIDYLHKALDLCKELKDDNQKDLIPIHHYLGLSHGHLKQHDKANEHYQLTYDIGKQVHGEEHHNNTAPLLNLAKGAEKLGKLDRAESLYKEAVSIEDKRVPKHPFLLTDCWIELGHFYQRQNKKSEAEQAYRKAIITYDQLPAHLKRRFYELPSAMTALLKEEGKTEEAEELSRKYLHVHTPHGEAHFRL
jgi:tetratricopeptide (TPR) repeat protein